MEEKIDACAQNILEELHRQMPFLYRATIAPTVVSIESRVQELEFVGQRLKSLHGNSENWIAESVRAFVVLSLEFLRLQHTLEKTGRYLLSSEQEAFEKVYDNKDVFAGYYLSGLLLSEVLWPNHFCLNKLFKEQFIPLLDKKCRVVEVGVGTGYHLCYLLKELSEVHYTGIDISQFAVDYCKRFNQLDARSGDVQFILKNISSGSNLDADSVDGFVLGELLEHVENPGMILRDLRRAAKSHCVMFATTVIYTANIDHIYLFHNAAEVRTLISENGWVIVKEMILPVYSKDNPEMDRRPMNYGAVLAPSPTLLV